MCDNRNVLVSNAAERIRTRESNLELYRIIGMLLIVTHHYVVNSGLTDSVGIVYQHPLSPRSICLLMMGAFGKTGINGFLMITGYFMCRSAITAKKFAKLFCEVVFYNVIVYLLFLLTGYESISLKSVILRFFPVNSIVTNFTGCFLAFFLFIPFINAFIKHINERQHFYLLLLCGFVYVVLGTLHRTNINYVEWFVVIYLMASYIRCYPKKIYSDIRIWAVLMAVSTLLLCLSVATGLWIYARTGRNLSYFFVTDSNSFLPVVIGLSSFMFFKNLRIRHSKIINTVAASTFGVLCIHANCDAMRIWLWRDLLDNVGHYSPLHAVISVLSVFAVCTLIDMIRIRFIEEPFFKVWDKKFPAVRTKYEKIEKIWFEKLESM